MNVIPILKRDIYIKKTGTLIVIIEDYDNKK
jgi:hypothetical protein